MYITSTELNVNLTFFQIPLLLTQLVGVGGVIPVHICSWSPYLSQFQFHPEPMGFAIRTFFLMQVVVYIATLGAGGRK